MSKRWGIVVVACGKICGKMCGKIKNCHRFIKTFACVSLRHRKHDGGRVILVVVCGKICGCGKMCGKIETLWDWNKIWCGSRY